MKTSTTPNLAAGTDLEMVCTQLNTRALAAWSNWLETNQEVMNAAALLTERNFAAFMENNCKRLLAEFARAEGVL